MTIRTDELERLANLHEKGALSASEFAAAKASVFQAQEGISGDPMEAGAMDSSWAENESEEEARSQFSAGYYTATAASIQGALFLSNYPVISSEDNIALVVTLLVTIVVVFYAAWRVAAKQSTTAAWCLLGLVGCQLFGVVTSDGLGFGRLALGVVGVAAGIQAVRAVNAYRKMSIGHNSIEDEK